MTSTGKFKGSHCPIPVLLPKLRASFRSFTQRRKQSTSEYLPQTLPSVRLGTVSERVV